MIITSWDDYSEHNDRLAKLLLKYKIPAIFFIEIDRDEKMQQIRRLARAGFAIGCHTWSHPMDMKAIGDEDLNFETFEARQKIESVIQRRITWFCYPRGRYNKRVIDAVRAAGFFNARTTKIGYAGKEYEKNGYHCFQREEYEGVGWLDYIKTHIDMAGNSEMHIWGHAKEINKYNEWDKLDELFKYIYAQNIHSESV